MNCQLTVRVGAKPGGASFCPKVTVTVESLAGFRKPTSGPLFQGGERPHDQAHGHFGVEGVDVRGISYSGRCC